MNLSESHYVCLDLFLTAATLSGSLVSSLRLNTVLWFTPNLFATSVALPLNEFGSILSLPVDAILTNEPKYVSDHPKSDVGEIAPYTETGCNRGFKVAVR